MPAAAAIPAIIGGVSGLATTGTGIAQAIGAGKEAKRIKEAIDNYQRQTLTNPYGGLQVSTLGADRMREDLARTVATMTEQAALGGIKGVASLAPNIVQQQNAQEAQIAANLDEQEKQRQQMIAQGNAMVQQMTEQRENNDLLGLGQQLSVAQQNKANGWNTFARGMAGLGSAASAGLFDNLGTGDNYFNSKGYKDSQIQTVLPGAQVSPINSGLHNNLISRLPSANNIKIPKLNYNPNLGLFNIGNPMAFNNSFTIPKL